MNERAELAREVGADPDTLHRLLRAKREDHRLAACVPTQPGWKHVGTYVDQTSGAHSGNAYAAWSQYNGFAPNNAVLFSRSTDHGLTFSKPIRVTPG